jgi:proteasome lid subunit RPN8/RPN11
VSLSLSPEILAAIHADGESAYPEEGAGLLLGSAGEAGRTVTALFRLRNEREYSARHNRYLITPLELLRGEEEAARQGLDVIGIYHSHPDHPNQPSEFDREWALPWYSYVITSVNGGSAVESRAWRLAEDHSQFIEEEIIRIPVEKEVR